MRSWYRSLKVNTLLRGPNKLHLWNIFLKTSVEVLISGIAWSSLVLSFLPNVNDAGISPALERGAFLYAWTNLKVLCKHSLCCFWLTWKFVLCVLQVSLPQDYMVLSCRVCLMPLFITKVANSSYVKCKPLLETICSNSIEYTDCYWWCWNDLSPFRMSIHYEEKQWTYGLCER